MPAAEEDVCKRYYEYNLPKFTDKTLDKVLPFEQVAGHVEEYLSAQSLMNGIHKYIQLLAANTKIKGFHFKDPEAVIGGESVHHLSYSFLIVPVFFNAIIILSIAM